MKKLLLTNNADPLAITAALRGAGGYGKTTLAKALAHDPEIKKTYTGGILWVEVGNQPEDLVSIVSDLIEMMTGKHPTLTSINMAAARLGKTLGRKKILLIIDDVWREEDLFPFLQGGINTTRLITTRIDTVLPKHVKRQIVDAMQSDEAYDLLASGLPQEQLNMQRDILYDLAVRLGKWPLLLKLVNGFLYDRCVRSGKSLGKTIIDVKDRLEEKGLTAFDASKESDRNKAVALTMNLSLNLLDEQQRELFKALAIFPEDIDIQIGSVARLWRLRSSLGKSATEDLLSKLYSLSLLLKFDFQEETLRLHDTVHSFLRGLLGEQGLAALRILLRPMGGLRDSADIGVPRYYHLPDTSTFSRAEFSTLLEGLTPSLTAIRPIAPSRDDSDEHE